MGSNRQSDIYYTYTIYIIHIIFIYCFKVMLYPNIIYIIYIYYIHIIYILYIYIYYIYIYIKLKSNRQICMWIKNTFFISNCYFHFFSCFFNLKRWEISVINKKYAFYSPRCGRSQVICSKRNEKICFLFVCIYIYIYEFIYIYINIY